MYWFEQVESQAMVDHANEDLALGRCCKTGEREALPSTLKERQNQLQPRPATLADKEKVEDDEGLYTCESSQRWIGRFDDNSEWPSAAVHRLCTMASHPNTPDALVGANETPPPP